MRSFPSQSVLRAALRLTLLLAACGALLIPAAFAAISNYKISGAGLSYPGVGAFELSRDGRYAVFNVNEPATGHPVELRTAFVMGGATPILLEGPLTSGDNIMNYEISPDSSRVVYITRQGFGSGQALHSIEITGGQRIQLNAPLVSGGGIRAFWISSDSQRVVYRADQEVVGQEELYSVPLTGGSVTKLNGPLNGTGLLSYPQISPDGQHVVYSANQQSGGIGLYSVPITGGTPIGLRVGLQIPVHSPKISPDSQWVLYSEQVSGGQGLFSVPIGGGTPIPLSDPAVHGSINTGINPGLFNASANSQWVVFIADQLYRVPIAGGAVAQLNGPLTSGGGVRSWGITSDSQHVIYIADQETDETFELYSTPITISAPTKLNPTLVSGGDVAAAVVARNSEWVVYQANQEMANTLELYSVPITGGPSIKLNPPFRPGLVTFSMRISPNSQYVIYIRGLQNDDCCLFRVPITGGASTRLHPALVNIPLPRFFTPRFSPDSARVIYGANQEVGSVHELFVAFDEALAAPASRLYLPLIVR